jgi:16S rRNA A1518/A1519 N6-dimethyltransferase RsmA/KsgA/DIM1 with predicted DNA glycosylase/AP lyase activity
LSCLPQKGEGATAPTGNSRAKVVANLPFNLTKSILRRLLPLGDHISELYLMVQVLKQVLVCPEFQLLSAPATAQALQNVVHTAASPGQPLSSGDQFWLTASTCGSKDEVARRLVAGPDSGLDYRAMNLEVAFYSQPEYLFEVDRTAFIPAPNVDGAVVKFLLRPPRQWPLQTDLQFLSLVGALSPGTLTCGACLLSKIFVQYCKQLLPWFFVAQVRLAFAERRKMLRNTLQSRFSPNQLADAFAAAGVPLNARPQQLCLEDYVALWQNLPQNVVDTQPDVGSGS